MSNSFALRITMWNSNTSLQQSDKKYGGYYRLVPPKKTIYEHITNFILHILLLPYSIYKTFVGRLLSYLVINPLFRKEEQEDSLILQHPKHPDPLFSEMDEMSVINIVPKQHIIVRIILNWHNFLVNHAPTIKIANFFFRWIAKVFPNGNEYLDRYLDKLVDKVEAQIKGEKDKPFRPNQIHFRGIEHLDAKQQETLYEKLEARLGYDFRQNRKDIYFYSLTTPDNALLDSVEVRAPEAANEDISNRRFIITAMPRSNNFVDWLKQYKIYAKELDATLIAFNYRGVGFSKGVVTSEQNLYADAYSQVQRLLKLGARPENIALLGECLGANVATHTAGTLHEEGLPVKLFNARSFRSLTSIMEGRARPEHKTSSKHPFAWLGWIHYAFMKFIVTPIIKSARWSLDIDDKFLAIPPHDRDYMVVRSKKDEHGTRFADDKMIPHKKASTYSLVKEKTKELVKKSNEGAPLSIEEQEWLQDVPKQHKFYVSPELHDTANKADGHTVHPCLLVETNPEQNDARIDGRQYTINFFKRVWPKNTEVESQYEHLSSYK